MRRGSPWPKPPEWIADNEAMVGEWRSLWRSGVSVLWAHDQHDLVARLAAFRVTFRGHLGVNVDTMARLHPQITKLEEGLLLTARAQRAAGIEFTDAPAGGKAQRDEVAAKREELRKRAGGGA